jgi:hypothetical protein
MMILLGLWVIIEADPTPVLIRKSDSSNDEILILKNWLMNIE